jgi:pimeloyl-ACP methyl ester carboxylesterase
MNHHSPRSPDRTGPRASSEAYVVTRLGRLHVRVVGEGPTTVLWPSMFVDSHTWDPVVPLLPEGRRYVLVDPPGLGLSEALANRTDMVGAAEAALELLAGLGVDEPVDWVGNAFGGHVGFELGARAGVLRSLVAVSSPAEALPAGLRRQITVLLPILRSLGPVAPVRSAIVSGMLTDASAAEESIRRVVVDSLGRPSRQSMALAVRSFILDRRDVSGRLADVSVPCLFVASDDRGDWSPEDARRSATATPDAEVVTITGARTLIPLERPETFAAQLRRFWERLA